VLIISSGPRGKREALSPVAVMCWHAHGGNWPLAVLDLGYWEREGFYGERLR
jgi:hypothetical protein